jgi:L-cysteine desulfidase
LGSQPFAAPFFLENLKPLLAAGKVVFQPVSWMKTLQFMLDQGLVAEDVFEILAQLKPEHYQKGPEADRDGSAGNVMVFLYPYGKLMLYIKLKIWKDAKGDSCVVMSIHEEGMHD